MDVDMERGWKNCLASEFSKPYFARLADFVRSEYSSHTCYPPPKLVFNAFNLCPIADVKAVVIGQDPYHEPGQAHGLCFSVAGGTPPPPSLINIFKEITADTGHAPHTSGDLAEWARQGVLLLNSTLTVRARQANSHSGRGWERFTDAAIKAVSDNCSGVVFMLWGAFARRKAALVDPSKHLVLQAAHPSPLSANRGGWFGCGHFSKCNAYLESRGKTPIEW